MRRIEIIDYIRGGAMILVIIQHCHFLSTEILAFHMPLFLFYPDISSNIKKIAVLIIKR